MKSFLKFSELSLCDALSLSALTVAALLACFAFIKGTRLLLGERGGLRPVVAPSYYELLCEAYGDDESGKPFAVKQNWIRELGKLFKSTLNNRLCSNLACVIDESSRGVKLKRAFEELP